MTTMIPLILGEEAPHYNADQVRYLNLMLEMDRIRYTIDPIVESVCTNIEFAYKCPAHIDFISAVPSKNPKLAHCVQSDEICIRLFHLESGQDFFLTMESRLARTFLARLLASSLVDDSPHVLFSSTEKGIFNFILARLLGEIKKSLDNRMPNLKILGIFHAVDHVINEFSVNDHGACNFIVRFADNPYHVVLFCPRSILELGFTRVINRQLLLSRAGHINNNISFIIHRLKIPAAALIKLNSGDLIIFDHSAFSLNNNALKGDMKAQWDKFYLNGILQVKDNNYFFKTITTLGSAVEDYPMESVEITGAQLSYSKQLDALADLKVTVTIELSRLPMSLKELCELKSGEILDLHRKIGDPLELVVEGKTIGFCTPVQIDKRLGIKIIAINSAAESHDKN
jgi:flagellar motor switch protein FliN/FliY